MSSLTNDDLKLPDEEMSLMTCHPKAACHRLGAAQAVTGRAGQISHRRFGPGSSQVRQESVLPQHDARFS